MPGPHPQDVALAWQDAVNRMHKDDLLRLSDESIEIVGPRGVATGHEVLLQWLDRAGIQLMAERVFAAGDRVVVLQRAVWTDAATHDSSEQTVASAFRVAGNQVARLARFDDLSEALDDAGLSEADEVTSSLPPR